MKNNSLFDSRKMFLILDDLKNEPHTFLTFLKKALNGEHSKMLGDIESTFEKYPDFFKEFLNEINNHLDLTYEKYGFYETSKDYIKVENLPQLKQVLLNDNNYIKFLRHSFL